MTRWSMISCNPTPNFRRSWPSRRPARASRFRPSGRLQFRWLVRIVTTPYAARPRETDRPIVDRADSAPARPNRAIQMTTDRFWAVFYADGPFPDCIIPNVCYTEGLSSLLVTHFVGRSCKQTRWEDFASRGSILSQPRWSSRGTDDYYQRAENGIDWGVSAERQ